MAVTLTKNGFRVVSGNFGGKLTNFDSKEERKFEQKHLRSYLNGYERFTFGFVKDKETGKLVYPLQPQWHDVKRVVENSEQLLKSNVDGNE